MISDFSDNPVTVLGAGSWGTALAYMLAKPGMNVTLWDRSPTLIDEINRSRTNGKYLPSLVLPPKILGVSDMAKATDQATSTVVVALPSGAISEVLRELQQHLNSSILLVSATKGLDAETGQTMSEVIRALIPAKFNRGIVALSGPNLAKEVVQGIPSVCIAASVDPVAAREVQRLFMSDTFRVYTHSDILGVELAGSLKNVLAIGAGACEGLGFGDNTRAAMMTRGLMEMTQMGVAAGAQALTFLGIAGVGDLMATSASRLSRNYRVGVGLAHGHPLDVVLREIGQAAEGVPTSIAAYALARRYGIATPLFDTIHDVIHKGLNPQIAVTELMRRPPKDEGGSF